MPGAEPQPQPQPEPAEPGAPGGDSSLELATAASGSEQPGGGGPGAAAPAEPEAPEAGTRLVLPSDSPEEWARVEHVLRGGAAEPGAGPPLGQLSDLDRVLTQFSATMDEPKVCTFFSTVPGSAEAGQFDFEAFFAHGVPLMVAVALEMPQLFAGVAVPIFKMRSSWTAGAGRLGKQRFSLSRRQCACLLAHSFFGSLKRPADVQKNDFRFTIADLFMVCHGSQCLDGSSCVPPAATSKM